MNLYPGIIGQLKEELNLKSAKTVSEVWNALKSVISKSGVTEHESVIDSCFNSECCDFNGQRVLRLGLEYRLKYMIDGEEYEHSEDINCEFLIDDLSRELSREDKSRGIHHPADMYSLEQMFRNIEDWSSFKFYKNESYTYSVNGCEI